MGMFDYKGLTESQSHTLMADTLALTMYSYHGADIGFVSGYQTNGFGLGLPLTLAQAIFGGSGSSGILGSPEDDQKALNAVKAAGWTPISKETLDYSGTVDSRGTFYGETAGYTTAQMDVLGKYDAQGKLVSIGLAIRGTSGPGDNFLPDLVGDLVNDLNMFADADGYGKQYMKNAYDTLLGKVADFAKSKGLTSEDIVVTGHSLGGMATNSLAALSDKEWGGFYKDSNYVGYASPIIYDGLGKVLNVGYENDPALRLVTDGLLGVLKVNDAPRELTTNNIVHFNDHYESAAWSLLPGSLALNPSMIFSHAPSFYADGLSRISGSEFYDLTSRDSTVIVAQLSDQTRDNTWVQDLNRNAETHVGPTLILGTEHNDLIKGGKGTDYLEGGKGNDVFRDSGGYNLVSGGEGFDTFDVQKSISKFVVANDGAGSLYVKDAAGGISIVSGVESIKSVESGFLFLPIEKTFAVTAEGLKSSVGITAYAQSIQGTGQDNELVSQTRGEWMFGNDGNDTLISMGKNILVGGAGDDVLQLHGGSNTLLFDRAFGADRVEGFSATDKLVVIGGDDHSSNVQWTDYVSTVIGGEEMGTTLTVGDNSIFLVGVSAQDLSSGQIIIA